MARHNQKGEGGEGRPKAENEAIKQVNRDFADIVFSDIGAQQYTAETNENVSSDRTKADLDKLRDGLLAMNALSNIKGSITPAPMKFSTREKAFDAVHAGKAVHIKDSTGKEYFLTGGNAYASDYMYMKHASSYSGGILSGKQYNARKDLFLGIPVTRVSSTKNTIFGSKSESVGWMRWGYSIVRLGLADVAKRSEIMREMKTKSKDYDRLTKLMKDGKRPDLVQALQKMAERPDPKAAISKAPPADKVQIGESGMGVGANRDYATIKNDKATVVMDRHTGLPLAMTGDRKAAEKLIGDAFKMTEAQARAEAHRAIGDILRHRENTFSEKAALYSMKAAVNLRLLSGKDLREVVADLHKDMAKEGIHRSALDEHSNKKDFSEQNIAAGAKEEAKISLRQATELAQLRGDKPLAAEMAAARNGVEGMSQDQAGQMKQRADEYFGQASPAEVAGVHGQVTDKIAGADAARVNFEQKVINQLDGAIELARARGDIDAVENFEDMRAQVNEQGKGSLIAHAASDAARAYREDYGDSNQRPTSEVPFRWNGDTPQAASSKGSGQGDRPAPMSREESIAAAMARIPKAAPDQSAGRDSGGR